MKFIQRIFWAHMLVVVAALAIGYAWAGVWLVSMVFVLLGLLWFTARLRNSGGLEALLLYIFVIAAGVGIFYGLPSWLMLLTTVAALGAWDLDNFLLRLGMAKKIQFETGLGREHLRRLGIVEGVGFLAGMAALNLRAQLPFCWTGLLVLLAVIGIRQAIVFVRKQTGD